MKKIFLVLIVILIYSHLFFAQDKSEVLETQSENVGVELSLDDNSQQNLLYKDRTQADTARAIASGGEIIIYDVKDAIDLALQASEKMKLQEQQALLAMKTAKLSIKEFLPTLTFNWSESDSIKFHAADSRTKSLQFGFNLPVFNGGKTKISYDMGKLQAFYQYQKYQLDLKSFRSDIVRVYYDFLTARNTAETNRTLLENAETQLKITESEYRMGLVLETDYIDYLISVMDIKNKLKQSERNVRTLLREFKILVGLPLEANLVFPEENVPDVSMEFLLEPYTDLIWQIVQNTNLELKQEKVSMEYSRKQIKMNERFFIPSLGLEGGVSFSGAHYPLTQPSFSLKLTFSFQNNPVTPVTYSTNNTFNTKTLTGISNNLDTSIVPDITYGLSRTANNLTAADSKNKFKEKTHTLEEDVFSKIAVHDDCLDSIEITKDMLELKSRRLEISKAKVDKGELKRLDYLKELEEYANEQIKLEQLFNSLLSSWHELELLTDLPLGELKNVCVSSNL